MAVDITSNQANRLGQETLPYHKVNVKALGIARSRLFSKLMKFYAFSGRILVYGFPLSLPPRFFSSIRSASMVSPRLCLDVDSRGPRALLRTQCPERRSHG